MTIREQLDLIKKDWEDGGKKITNEMIGQIRDICKQATGITPGNTYNYGVYIEQLYLTRMYWVAMGGDPLIVEIWADDYGRPPFTLEDEKRLSKGTLGNISKWKWLCILLEPLINNKWTNEATFQEFFVMGLQNIFNWDNSSIKEQQAIQMGSETKFADIVLHGEDFGIVIEMKCPTVTQFDNTEIDKIASYMRILNCKYGLLVGNRVKLMYDNNASNGKLLEVVNFPFESDNPDGVALGKILNKTVCSNVQLKKYAEQKLWKNQLKSLKNELLANNGEKVKIMVKNQLVLEGHTEKTIDKILDDIAVEIKKRNLYLPPTLISGRKIKKSRLASHLTTNNKRRKTIPERQLIIGAIAGDIIGSTHESKSKQVKSLNFDLFPNRTKFTDDSVLTIATMQALLKQTDYTHTYQRFGRTYPQRGYGRRFKSWIYSDNPKPYNSYGNGSAMRVSPIGWYCDSIDDVLGKAKKSSEVTHNHPEGIKGAQAAAAAVYLARTKKSKAEIKKFIIDTFDYDLDRTIDEIRLGYKFDVSCQGSVPEAIIAFLESTDYENAVRLAVSIGGDSDTIACITGGIAEAYYKKIPHYIRKMVSIIVEPNLMMDVVIPFSKKYGGIGEDTFDDEDGLDNDEYDELDDD